MAELEIFKDHVSARGLVATLDMARALGGDPLAIAEEAGLVYELLSVPETLVPVQRYYCFLQAVYRHTKVADVGLYIGRISHVENMHLFLYLASTSRTMREWLNRVPSVADLIGDLGEFRISSAERKTFALQWRPVQGNKPPGEQRIITDCVLATAAAQMDCFSAMPVRPIRVDFTYPRPDDTRALQEVLGGELRFGRKISALHYDRSVLDYPLVRVSTRFYDNVAREFSRLFSKDQAISDPFLVSLHTSIRRQLPTGECSIEAVAKDLNVSRRTLQRRISERGTNFQQMLHGIKSELAKRYLADNRLSNIDIAFLLGYSDQSTFSAAFKGWNRMTPTEFRQQLLAD